MEHTGGKHEFRVTLSVPVLQTLLLVLIAAGTIAAALFIHEQNDMLEHPRQSPSQQIYQVPGLESLPQQSLHL